MNAVQFSSALGKVNDKYIMEAITYSKFERSDLSYKISAGQIEIMSLISVPDKDNPPAEYPSTTIVPGFDLDESSEPDTP